MSWFITVMISALIALGSYTYSLGLKLTQADQMYKTEQKKLLNALQEVSEYEAAVTLRDKQTTKHLADLQVIKNAHQNLVNGIANGDYVVRVAATCPPSTEASSGTTPLIGASPELVGDIRQSYLDFREAYQLQLSRHIELQTFCK